MVTLLDAVKMAYRKHHLDDPSVGWDELSDVLMIALCNEMGDKGFQSWLNQVSAQQNVQRTASNVCEYCGRSDGSHDISKHVAYIRSRHAAKT